MGTPSKAQTTQGATALAYPAKLTKDTDGRILISFKDFPECLTDGADETEALLEAKDALSEAIMGRLARGEGIPAARTPIPGERQIAPFPDTAMKLAIARAVDDAGWSTSELARQMDVDEKEARRILDPEHRTKLGRLSAALMATGQDVVVSTRAMADMTSVIAAKQLRGPRKVRVAAKRKAAKKRARA